MLLGRSNYLRVFFTPPPFTRRELGEKRGQREDEGELEKARKWGIRPRNIPGGRERSQVGNPAAKHPERKWRSKIVREILGENESSGTRRKNGEILTGHQNIKSQSGFECGRAREHSPTVGCISCANRTDFRSYDAVASFDAVADSLSVRTSCAKSFCHFRVAWRGFLPVFGGEGS